MDSVLMIGGGIQQRDAIAEAHALGLRVIVTDRNPSAPAFEFADEAVVIDGRDVEGLIAWTLAHASSRRIRGVFTVSELVTSVACVAGAAELPGVELAAAVRCQDKALCKARWLAAGVPTPRGGVARTVAEARSLLRDLGAGPGHPAFLKPARGAGSEGAGAVVSVDDPRIRTALAGPGPHRPLIVEERIEGSMHDVNGLFDDQGRFHPLGIVDRAFQAERPVETGIGVPSELSEEDAAVLYALLERGMRALGIERGPVKADAVREAAGFRLLEVAPRLHGPKNSLVALPLVGLHPWRAALAWATGRAIDPRDLCTTPQRACVCRAILAGPGRLERVVGMERARAVFGISRIQLYRRAGDWLGASDGRAEVVGHVFALGEDRASCERRLDSASAALEIRVGLVPPEPSRPRPIDQALRMHQG